jgi:hypothetical protein
MSKATQLKEDRMKKFQNMGIPVPMEPVDPSLLRNANADPEKLKKLDAIRNGLKKNEFQSFIQKTGPTPTNRFESIPVPKQKKNPNAPNPTNVPEIKSFSPDSSSSSEAILLEKALYGEIDSPYQESHTGNKSGPRVLYEEVNDDPTGSKFLSDFKSRMRSSVATKTPVSGTISKPINEQSTGFVITEEELDKRILSIATQVSKNMIKKVITESAKSGSGIIIETDRVKKVELVGNNVVKLNGKLYKLTPVKEQQ